MARSACSRTGETARCPILLVNDSDISVEQDYLRSVVAPLEDPRVGVVTCLYRARAESGPSRWEAIGLATEFAPSVLVARLIGESGFALGSTMVFRAEQIRQIGGFEAVEDYLADDYQLGAHIAALGYKVALAQHGGRDRPGRRENGATCGGINCAGRAPSASRGRAGTSGTW